MSGAPEPISPTYPMKTPASSTLAVLCSKEWESEALSRYPLENPDGEDFTRVQQAAAELAWGGDVVVLWTPSDVAGRIGMVGVAQDDPKAGRVVVSPTRKGFNPLPHEFTYFVRVGETNLSVGGFSSVFTCALAGDLTFKAMMRSLRG